MFYNEILYLFLFLSRLPVYNTLAQIRYDMDISTSYLLNYLCLLCKDLLDIFG
ncbi:hypothetical protein CLOSTMETH_03240 [[Clostridium] methylpentosum DSM 5476]|uniref:Uncharacterized protein n=1 Tax=[Clostridium] methylpentosum DSM 5476 TaxID=537013 RepID=C0EH40_9FIRM|nr:hypothetical protein CLOSTMETH_03240 [[Clostridium] methylpentosum DSM 5476]